MVRRHKRRRTGAPVFTLDQIADEIKLELRSIIRQRNSLLVPIIPSQVINGVPDGQPKYRAVFDRMPLQPITGLKIKATIITLFDEKIIDDVLHYAQSVWHLKDRLNLWVKLKNIGYNIEEAVQNNMNLMICADLANRKKHGRSENRSGFAPKLNEKIEFDTSKNGLIEFYCDWNRMEKELIVSNPTPIPFRAEILKDDNTVFSDNAVIYITQAFLYWLEILEKMCFWENDVESKEIRWMCHSVPGLQ